MPAFRYVVNDDIDRGDNHLYDLKDILVSAAAVPASEIEAVTSVTFELNIQDDLVQADAVAAWRLQCFSQGSIIQSNWTSSDANVPASVEVGRIGNIGVAYTPPHPGQQIVDGTTLVTFYPVDGEAVVDGYQPDGTYMDVAVRAVTAATGADAPAGDNCTGQLVAMTIWYSTVSSGVLPTGCGVFGHGSFGIAKFGLACAIVDAAFTVSPTNVGLAPTSFDFDGSASSVSPVEALTYSWDFGDGTVGSGVTPSHTYAEPGLYRVTLAAFAASGTYDSTYQIIIVGSATSDVPVGRTILGNLGHCPMDRYSVEIVSRGGYSKLADLSEWCEEIDYNRVMNETSQADVTIRKREGCHTALAWVDPWATELRIWRGDDMVWEGPIVEYEEFQESVRITARDVTEWTKYRVMNRTIDHTILPGVLPTQIAQEVLEQAFEKDDPRVLQYMDIRECSCPNHIGYITRKIEVDDDDTPKITAGEIRTLAGSFVDYTTIGRRIIVWPDNYYLSSVGTIMQRHLQGDGWSIRSRGADYGNHFIMQGDAVVGKFGGQDERYGLVEQLLRDETILDTTTAKKAAQTMHETRAARPARWLVLSDGTELSPETPIELDRLVPGVRAIVDIGGDEIAQPFRQNLRITRVSVGVDQDGESVRIGALAVGFEDFPLGEIGEIASLGDNQPPTAAYTMSETAGTVPLLVSFDASGSIDPEGGGLIYEWDFGDGTTDSGIAVEHNFVVAGNYDVILRVVDTGNRFHSVVYSVAVATLTGNLLPTATFSTIINGQDVDFDSTGSTDPDGTIVSWLWDFGDTNSSSAENPSHTYAADGDYTVTLTVTDNMGDYDAFVQILQIGAPPAPGPVDMVVLADSIAHLHTGEWMGASPVNQKALRTRWQDQMARTLAIKNGRAFEERHFYSQDVGGAGPSGDPPTLPTGTWQEDGPDATGDVDVFRQWDASIPGWLSDFYDTNGQWLEYPAEDSPYVTGLPPSAAPKYVFIALGFNDVHAGPAFGQAPRTAATIQANLVALAQPYKATADVIVFVQSWDVEATNPAAAFVFPGHFVNPAGDMNASWAGNISAKDELIADVTCTADVLITDLPTAFPSYTQDGGHPTDAGHDYLYQQVRDTLEAGGYLDPLDP